MPSKRTPASTMALGGVLAALAVVIMSMGTLIPVATYVCPVLCCVTEQLVLRSCGRRVAWAWYGAVAILSLLLAPDKEAAAVFVAIGYYPILKPRLDKMKFGLPLKALIFNISIFAMCWVLMRLLGMEQISAEFEAMGMAMTVVLLLLGNVTFFLLDRLLGMRPKRRKQGG